MHAKIIYTFIYTQPTLKQWDKLAYHPIDDFHHQSTIFLEKKHVIPAKATALEGFV